ENNQDNTQFLCAVLARTINETYSYEGLNLIGPLTGLPFEYQKNQLAIDPAVDLQRFKDKIQQQTNTQEKSQKAHSTLIIVILCVIFILCGIAVCWAIINKQRLTRWRQRILAQLDSAVRIDSSRSQPPQKEFESREVKHDEESQ